MQGTSLRVPWSPLRILLMQCRAQDSLSLYGPGSPQRRRRLRQSICLGLGCVAFSTVIVVMEAYAIMALQFCDGEDLISLYWSTWTMLQVGSLIAMFGIILALANTMRNHRHPYVFFLVKPSTRLTKYSGLGLSH